MCREISFQFRTRLPHGLLVYHSVKNRPGGLEPYALYVIVEKGQLKVVHVIGKHSTSVTVGEGAFARPPAYTAKPGVSQERTLTFLHCPQA